MRAAGGLWPLVEARAAATPEALLAVDEADRRLSFAGYREAALRCAAGLARRGVGAGTRVSWMLPTWLESLVLTGALARLGALQNPILPIYRERETGFIARQLGTRLLCVPSRWRGFDYAAMARALAGEQEGLEVLVVERGASPALPEGDPATLPPPPPPTAPGDAPVRWCFYTSGTTADPKGALHTDHTLLAAAGGMVAALAVGPADRVAMVFPCTHVGGVLWLLCALLSGCGQILVEAFDPRTSIAVLARHRVTLATAGTVFHQAYLAAQREAGPTPLFPAVRAFPGGGAPKPPQLHTDLLREMGAGIVSGYGLTECPSLTMNSVGDADEKLAHSEGRASPPGMRIRVVAADGRPAAPGQEGEIRARGPQLCKGYLDASLDAEAFDEEGYLRTGDLGYLDAEGYLVVTGRTKDVIIRKGENISAKEVEDLLHRHPRVAEVAVIGLPDPQTGERCCAVVVCRDPAAPLSFAEMSRFLREQGLSTRKIPERLELVAALPRNPTGKVLKQKLREAYAG